MKLNQQPTLFCRPTHPRPTSPTASRKGPKVVCLEFFEKSSWGNLHFFLKASWLMQPPLFRAHGKGAVLTNPSQNSTQLKIFMPFYSITRKIQSKTIWTYMSVILNVSSRVLVMALISNLGWGALFAFDLHWYTLIHTTLEKCVKFYLLLQLLCKLGQLFLPHWWLTSIQLVFLPRLYSRSTYITITLHVPRIRFY